MKKLILCVIAFFMMLSISWSAEIGQKCTMPQGSDVIQKLENPFVPFRGVTVPADQEVYVESKILDEDFTFLKNNMPADHWNEDWKNAFLVEFDYNFGDETGVQKLRILARPQHLKDCK